MEATGKRKSTSRRKIKPPPPFLTTSEARELAAKKEYLKYQFFRVSRATWVDCVNNETGETYEVSIDGCTCWDAVTLKPYGIKCKHWHMHEIACSRGDVHFPPAPMKQKGTQ